MIKSKLTSFKDTNLLYEDHFIWKSIKHEKRRIFRDLYRMVRLVKNEQVTNSENKYLWTVDAESAPDYDSILIFKTSKSQNMVMECKGKK